MFTKTRLSILVALFLTATGNIAFFQNVSEIYSIDNNLGFLISLVLFLWATTTLLVSFFVLLIPVRISATLLILLASVTAYFSDQFGTVINTGMVRNLFATDVSEAGDLMSSGLLIRVMLLGLLPATLIWLIPIKKSAWVHELRYTLQTGALSFVAMVLCVLAFSDHYASFFREHKPIRYYANPVTPVYSIGKYFSEVLNPASDRTFNELVTDATTPEDDNDPELIVLVVGETARADHFSLNGYTRDTNPLLAKEDRLVSFNHFDSCGTDTAYSVPCIFAFAGRSTFEVSDARHTENVLDVLSKAGINVLWRDNNSDSKGVATRVTYESYKSSEINPVCDSECRDVGMLSGLQEYVEQNAGDILIVLHQMGSHGPAYFKRYPPEFEQFKPACQSIELSACSQEEIINAYDNTLLYTDYFLSQVIQFLKANTPDYETAMFYVSDHGESLGENNIYLHGMPYVFAPKAQTHVPFIAWIGPTADIDLEDMQRIKDFPNSHDALSWSLLKAFEVEANFKHMKKGSKRVFEKVHGSHGK